MADDNGSQKVTVDGKEFSMDELSENAKAQFVNLQFVDAQLLQLQNELAVADTARIGYTNALNNELSKSSKAES